MKGAFPGFTYLLCLLSSLFFCIAFADTISSTASQKCEDLTNQEAMDITMEKGVMTTMAGKFNINTERQQTIINCSIPSSVQLKDDTVIRISVMKKDGITAEAENKVGVPSISTTLECGSDGWWYFPNVVDYPLTGQIFCEVPKTEIRRKTTTPGPSTTSTTTTNATPQTPKCEKIINGEPFTEGMEKGVLETSNYTFNKDIWKNKTTVRCSVPNSIPWNDTIMLSISAMQKDGTISELIVRTGHAAIVIAYECGNDGWWYSSEPKSYPLTGKIFCEVSKSDKTTTTTTRGLTTISTTTPTNINRCTGCNQNILKRNLTSGMENGIVTFQENIVSGCQVIYIWCSGADPSTVNYTLLTVTSDLRKLTHMSERNGSERVGVRLICGKDALWYYEHHTINNPSTHVLDTILCGVTRSRSSTPGLTTTTTTRLPNEVFTTTSTTTTPTTTSSLGSCGNNKKYKILSSKVDSNFSTKGKFGGFYKIRSICKNLCTQSYGMFKCVAFMYDPKNHGKCTIFESAVDGMIIENTKSNAVVVKKCF